MATARSRRPFPYFPRSKGSSLSPPPSSLMCCRVRSRSCSHSSSSSVRAPRRSARPSGRSCCCGFLLSRRWASGESSAIRPCCGRSIPRTGSSICRSGGFTGFLVLGGVFLCVTGAEALYADMGHFGPKPIRLAWTAVVLPSAGTQLCGAGSDRARGRADRRQHLLSAVPCSLSHPADPARHHRHHHREPVHHHRRLLDDASGHPVGLAAAPADFANFRTGLRANLCGPGELAPDVGDARTRAGFQEFRQSGVCLWRGGLGHDAPDLIPAVSCIARNLEVAARCVPCRDDAACDRGRRVSLGQSREGPEWRLCSGSARARRLRHDDDLARGDGSRARSDRPEPGADRRISSRASRRTTSPVCPARRCSSPARASARHL